MVALVSELTAILSEQAELYEQALALTNEEHDALRGRDPNLVIELVRRKETLLLQIKTLDESRRLILSRIAAAWQIPSSTLTITAIEKQIGAVPEAAALVNVRERLAGCVEKLHKANEINTRICQNGIEIMRRIVHGVAQSGGSTGAKEGGSPWAAYGVTTKKPMSTVSRY